MDHSCQPSACVSFSGYRLTVTCLRHVTSLTDLFISYCDTSLPTKLRREKLKRNYFFRQKRKNEKYQGYIFSIPPPQGNFLNALGGKLELDINSQQPSFKVFLLLFITQKSFLFSQSSN